MENLQNEKDLESLDYIQNEEDPNNFMHNDLINNFNNNIANNNINMNNPNYLNYENISNEINNEINTDFEFDRNNLDIENTQAAFVQTLNLQINQLQKLLEEKNKEFDNLNNENNKLKLLLIQEQKKIIEKDILIHSLNSNKKSYEDKINKYKMNEENLKNKIKELNYKIIELNQNMISKENMNQFNNKIKNIIESENNNEEINTNENNLIINEKIGVEITKLNNSIDELEIKNNKLVFENKTLNNKISTMISDKTDEINIYKSIYQTQINNLNKIISYLDSRISEAFSDKNANKAYNKVNNLISGEIIEKFNILESKLNSYDKENSELRKENQDIKIELDELKLVTKSKEKIIEKLQADFGMMENEYRNNIPNNLNQMGNIKNDEINSEEYAQYINELTNKQKALEKENYNLKNGLKQMTKNINEANDIYFKRKTQYDNNIKIRDNKLREYKNKISILKMKINELHQEIRVLKNNQAGNYNQTSFLSQNNNDINNNQFQNENMKLINHTPKLKRKEIPFELNLDNKDKNNEINDNKEIFGDIKISEVPKTTETQQQSNSIINPQDLKNIQEYKDLLNKVDEQLLKYN